MRLIKFVERFARDEDGATAIEYALIAVIISISIAAAMTNIKGSLISTFTKVQTEMSAAAAN